jgi:transcriptional regulator with XRE-family HTH domain
MGEPSVLGRRLRAFRLRAGLSQGQLAELSGVPRPTITVVESGQQASMSIENGLKIADALGISLDELVRGDRLQKSEHIH